MWIGIPSSLRWFFELIRRNDCQQCKKPFQRNQNKNGFECLVWSCRNKSKTSEQFAKSFSTEFFTNTSLRVRIVYGVYRHSANHFWKRFSLFVLACAWNKISFRFLTLIFTLLISEDLNFAVKKMQRYAFHTTKDMKNHYKIELHGSILNFRLHWYFCCRRHFGRLYFCLLCKQFHSYLYQNQAYWSRVKRPFAFACIGKRMR